MKRSTLLLSLMAVAALAAAPCSALAAKFNKKVEIGQSAPEMKQLVDADGKEVPKDTFKDAKALVVVFTSNGCPVAVAYEDRLIELQKKYSDKGVKVIAVNCNNSENEEAMKERVNEKKINYAYLKDTTQDSGRDFGATCTPHVFVLDGSRKIAYMGAIDDNMREDKVTKHYVADAIDAVLDGKTPETTETLQRGCGIRYK